MNIQAQKLKERLAAGENICMIDVREELEYHTFNIGGQNIPLGTLAGKIEDLEFNKSDEIIIVCQRGIRSATGQKILQSAGFTNVKNLEGGLLSYRKIST
jgi:rhodanese-related sulfurtransferase